MLRVVLDTNVIISGLFFKGPPARILDGVAAGTVVPLFNQITLLELQRTLTYSKFQDRIALLPFTTHDFIEELLQHSELFESQPIAVDAVRDPADNFILACALTAHADFLITGDKDLLVLGSFMGMPIVSPASFVSRYGI